MENSLELEVIYEILQHYGFYQKIVSQKEYIHAIEDNGWMKLIFRVTLEDGRLLVIKVLHEDDDHDAELQKIQKQSAFSELLRNHGIRTPHRYQVDGRFYKTLTYRNISCVVTLEDWCGEEIGEINTDIAFRIGELMAQMHIISLENKCKIGHRTLFCAAYWNDVDSFPEFCEITKNDKLDQNVVAQIKALRSEKLDRIRQVWDILPKAAVQGDISINNLVLDEKGLIVFDYNNAGDEVLVSDLVMEGLLTAYEMDLPDGVSASYREELFPAFLKGYLSVRALNMTERTIAWEIYTLFHGLWFTRIVYNEESLDSLVKKGDYIAANRLLNQMLRDMQESDDGRFRAEH